MKRFCDKLPMLRKNNNYSQEQLAELLNVSRQAVSKWELGGSYPDMDKMLQICKVLNCTLEDLMDDGSLGESFSESAKRRNFNDYLQNFLGFVTKSYNMFCSMKFWQKVKCILEMLCIIGALWIIGIILTSLTTAFLKSMLGYSRVVMIFARIISNIVGVAVFVIGAILTLHLFKIRYLDYFITVEDQNVTTRTVEEPFDKNEDRHYREKPREKVIIRDAVHGTANFFDGLWKIIVFITKFFVAMLEVFVAFAGIALMTCIAVSVYHIQYSVIFWWIMVGFIGGGLLCYIILEWGYNFIVNRKHHLKRIFIISMIGIALIGIGIGLSIGTYLTFDTSETILAENVLTIEQGDNAVFNFEDMGYELEIDNSVNDIKVLVKHASFVSNVRLYEREVNQYKIYGLSYNRSFNDFYKTIMPELKNNKIINMDEIDQLDVTVIMSEATRNKLKENYKDYIDYIESQHSSSHYR